MSTPEQPRRDLSAAAFWLPGLVGRIPVTLHAKLLVGMLLIVGLFLAVGLVGLEVLGAANERASDLGQLERKVAAYHALQTGINRDLAAAASALAAADAETSEESLRQLGQSSYDLDRVQFVAPEEGMSAEETALLEEVEKDGTAFLAVLIAIVQMVRDGDRETALATMETEAEPLVRDLERQTSALIVRAQSDVVTTVDDNHEDYLASRNMFLALAAGSVVLALLMGYAISWSIIGPVRHMDTQLARVSSGDFSRHVEVPNRDELGALAANLNRMNDELGRLYRELETASRHKSEYLANMSHELRTPLNAIIGFSEVLQENMVGELNEKQREYVADILGSGRHLLSLINDILDLSKVEAGRMDLETGEFSLSQALENGVSMVRERALRRGVTVNVAADPGLETVTADERKVKQVIYNLLTNAVKFTEAGGRVDVGASRVAGAVRVSVRDTGIGIAPEDQERIFEEFSQVSRTGSVDQEGTGLGLALARKFVQLQGGEIGVESALGEGSTFWFTLPGSVSESEAADLPDPAPPAAVPSQPPPATLKEAPHGR